MNRVKDLESRSLTGSPSVEEPPSNEGTGTGTGKGKEKLIIPEQAEAAKLAEATSSFTRTSELDRWRVEEVGHFDGTTDVYEFIDRLQSISAMKSLKLISRNIVTCFINDKDDSLFSREAYNWWISELSNLTRKTLVAQNTLDPLCAALKKRFGTPQNQLLEQLTAMRYTRKDVANEKNATAFVGEVMMLCYRINGNTQQYTWQQSLQLAFDRFEGPLRNTLKAPTGNLEDFTSDVRMRQPGWYESYHNYGKSKLQQGGYYGPGKNDFDPSKPRYAEPRQNNNKFKTRSSDKYRPIGGNARKALPAPDPSKVYHLRHDDSSSDVEDDDTRPSPNDEHVGAYFVDNQAHVCNEKGDVWSSQSPYWTSSVIGAAKNSK